MPLNQNFKLLPDKIDKHTKSVKNWKSNTKSQWAPNWSNHSNCIIYKVFFVECLFICDWEVNRYLYVSYSQRYEWLKVIRNIVKIWVLLSFYQNCLETFPKQKLIWKLTTEISDTFWIQKILLSMQRKSRKKLFGMFFNFSYTFLVPSSI